MLKSNPSYLGPPKSALGLRPWADFGGPRAGFFPEFLGQGLDFLPKWVCIPKARNLGDIICDNTNIPTMSKGSRKEAFKEPRKKHIEQVSWIS